MSSKGFSIAKMRNTNSKLHQSFNKSAWTETYLPLHSQSPNQQYGHSQSDSKKNKLSYSQSFSAAQDNKKTQKKNDNLPINNKRFGSHDVFRESMGGSSTKFWDSSDPTE